MKFLVVAGIAGLAATASACTEKCKPYITEPQKPVAASAPKGSVPDDICAYAPAGLKGVSVADVAYKVSPGLYQCEGNADFMKIWCIKQDGKRDQFWYCCGKTCDYTPSVPKTQKCKVNGKTYTVGKTYNVNGGKLWCTAPDNYVTCKGKQCGSTIELTPPGLSVSGGNPPPPPPPPPGPVITTCKQWNRCPIGGSQLKPNANAIQCRVPGTRRSSPPGPAYCSVDVCCEAFLPPTTCNDWFAPPSNGECPSPATPKPENEAGKIQCTIPKPGARPSPKDCRNAICCNYSPVDTTCLSYTCSVGGDKVNSGSGCSTLPGHPQQCSDEFCRCRFG